MKIQARLNLKAAFNFRTPHYFPYDDHRLLYVAGRFIVQFNHLTHQHNFIPLYELTQEVLTVAMPSNRKFVIVVQIVSGQTFCSFYSLKKQRKTIKIDSKQLKIKALGVCRQDSSSIVLVTKAPNDSHSRIHMLDFSKLKILGSSLIDGQVNEVCVHNESSQIMVVLGHGLFKLLRFHQKSFIVQTDSIRKVKMNENFIFGGWFSDEYFILSNQTTIFLLSKAMELIQIIFSGTSLIVAVTPFSKGVIVSNEEGLYSVIQISEGRSNLLYRFQLQLGKKQFVIKPRKVQIFPSEDFILHVLDNLEVVVSRFQMAEAISTLKDPESTIKVSSQILIKRNNQTEIKTVCVPKLKSIAAVIFKNLPIVTIYNLQTSSQEIKKYFNLRNSLDNESIHAASLSADGEVLVLAFNQQVKLYHVLANQLKQFCQIPLKSVNKIRFSQGDHLIALHCIGKSPCVMIYRRINMQLVKSLKAYGVKNIYWGGNDHRFYMLLQSEIHIYETFSFAHEVVRASAQSVRALQARDFVVSGDNLSQFKDGKLVSLESGRNSYSSLCSLQNQYVSSNQKGYLQISKPNFQQSQKISLHLKQFKVSCGLNKLWVVCWDDCNLLILQQAKNKQQETMKKSYFQLVSMVKEDYTQNQKKLKNCEERLDSLKIQVIQKQDDQLRLIEKERLAIIAKAEEQTNIWKVRYNQLKSHKNQVQKEAVGLFKNMQIQQISCMQELQLHFRKKLQQQKQRIIILQQQFSEQRLAWIEKVKRLELKHEKDILSLRDKYQQKIKSQSQEFNQFRVLVQNNRKTLLEELRQGSQEFQLELAELHHQKIKDVDLLQKKLISAKSNQHKMAARYAGIKKQSERMSEQNNIKQQKIQNLNRQLKQAQNRIQLAHKQNDSLIGSIEQRQIQISGLKKLVEQLKKAKQVLGFKAEQLKMQLQPKQKSIVKFQQQILRLENQLSKLNKKAFSQSDQVIKLEKLLQHQRHHSIRQTQKIRELQNWRNSLMLQLQNIVQKDRDQWARQLVKFYQKYSKNIQCVKPQANEKLQQQLTRHINLLQNSLNQANKNKKSTVSRRNAEMVRKLSENAGLIVDLNKLRQQYVSLRQDNKMKDRQINDLKKQVNSRPTSQFRKVRQEQPYQYVQDEVGKINKTTEGYMRLDSSNMPTRPTTRKRTGSTRGQVRKGANFDLFTMHTLDRARLMDMMAEIEGYQKVIKQQSVVIKDLNDRIGQ